jgi:hypothetical protein
VYDMLNFDAILSKYLDYMVRGHLEPKKSQGTFCLFFHFYVTIHCRKADFSSRWEELRLGEKKK